MQSSYLLIIFLLLEYYNPGWRIAFGSVILLYIVNNSEWAFIINQTDYIKSYMYCIIFISFYLMSLPIIRYIVIIYIYSLHNKLKFQFGWLSLLNQITYNCALINLFDLIKIVLFSYREMNFSQRKSTICSILRKIVIYFLYIYIQKKSSRFLHLIFDAKL